MQLNLFEWDIIAIGSGYSSLARFEFHEAHGFFARVLQALPDHPRASQGIKDTEYWEQTFRELQLINGEEVFRLGWNSICRFRFDHSQNHSLLRLNVLRHLQTMMNDRPDFYDPPQLCSGYLLLQLGKFGSAEQHLCLLLETQPNAGLIHLYLAESLWLQKKEELAGPSYARALLLDPFETCRQNISNKILVRLCEERGPALAPIYGFIAGILPLVDVEVMPSSPEIRIYAVLRRAEQSHRNGSHQQMIAARRELKYLAPEIFHDYLEATKKNISL